MNRSCVTGTAAIFFIHITPAIFQRQSYVFRNQNADKMSLPGKNIPKIRPPILKIALPFKSFSGLFHNFSQSCIKFLNFEFSSNRQPKVEYVQFVFLKDFQCLMFVFYPIQEDNLLTLQKMSRFL